MVRKVPLILFAGEMENLMEMILPYLKAFIIGGLLCVIGQILIDKTKLTPARILVTFVSAGVVLTGLGLYKPLVDYAGAGATVPLTGFGYALASGVLKAVRTTGLIGAFTGGFTATAGGIAGAVFFGYIFAVIFGGRGKTK